MLKIYGFDPSTWTNRVRSTANRLGLEYEYARIDLIEGEGQTEEYLAIHPAGKAPAMDDDGFRLFEKEVSRHEVLNVNHLDRTELSCLIKRGQFI